MGQPQPPEGQQRQDPQLGEPSSAQPPQAVRQPPPGWYPDPGGQRVLRWWDGTTWAQHTQQMPGAHPGAAPPGAGLGTAGQPQPAGRDSREGGGGSHWLRNILAGIGAVVVVVFVLAHISSGGSSASSPNAAADPAPSAAAACTTNACIASDAQQSLVGSVAKNDSVMTKATCRASTVKRNAGGTYTVVCTVTYSDGNVARGNASLIPAQNEITFEPTDIISYGSGG